MKFKFKLYFLIIVQILVNSEVYSKTSEKPKSIILFIGDGMGVAQVTTAIMKEIGSNFMRFTNGGLVLTSSSNSWITKAIPRSQRIRRILRCMLARSITGDPDPPTLELRRDHGDSGHLDRTNQICAWPGIPTAPYHRGTMGFHDRYASILGTEPLVEVPGRGVRLQDPEIDAKVRVRVRKPPAGPRHQRRADAGALGGLCHV